MPWSMSARVPEIGGLGSRSLKYQERLVESQEMIGHAVVGCAILMLFLFNLRHVEVGAVGSSNSGRVLKRGD